MPKRVSSSVEDGRRRQDFHQPRSPSGEVSECMMRLSKNLSHGSVMTFGNTAGFGDREAIALGIKTFHLLRRSLRVA
jgi:hypothetical protein